MQRAGREKKHQNALKNKQANKKRPQWQGEKCVSLVETKGTLTPAVQALTFSSQEVCPRADLDAQQRSTAHTAQI